MPKADVRALESSWKSVGKMVITDAPFDWKERMKVDVRAYGVDDHHESKWERMRVYESVSELMRERETWWKLIGGQKVDRRAWELMCEWMNVVESECQMTWERALMSLREQRSRWGNTRVKTVLFHCNFLKAIVLISFETRPLKMASTSFQNVKNNLTKFDSRQLL